MLRALCLTGVLLIALAGCRAAPAETPIAPLATPLPPTPVPLPTAAQTPFSGSAKVQLDDINMYYQVAGSGTPLILLHGGGSDSDSWANQFYAFSQQYRVVAPDSRAQGRTFDGEGPLTYHVMAEDTLKLMDHLAIDSAYLVGWSDGGVIGIDLAIHHPERVKALVAYGAHIRPDGLTDAWINEIRDTPMADWVKGAEGQYRQRFPDADPARLPVIIEKILTMWLTEPKFTADELASIKAPTLILDGEREEVIGAGHAKEIADAIPGAKLMLMPGAGHGAPATSPRDFNKIVLDFLKDK
jgi:pimeloyl-ACP methyl ester carboxylesterase